MRPQSGGGRKVAPLLKAMEGDTRQNNVQQ